MATTLKEKAKPNNPEQLEIWQWNCRSFARKAAALQQFIKSSQVAPDIICLQEVGPKPARLQGYYVLSDPQNPKVATLVSKTITAQMIFLPQRTGKQIP